jgi:hypothetical protein
MITHLFVSQVPPETGGREVQTSCQKRLSS